MDVIHWKIHAKRRTSGSTTHRKNEQNKQKNIWKTNKHTTISGRVLLASVNTNIKSIVISNVAKILKKDL